MNEKKHISQSLQNIKNTAEKKREENKKLPLKQQLQRANQLPLPWFDDVGLQSSTFVRGSVFSARSSKIPRALRNNEPTPLAGNLVAIVTGAELRQDDATILAKFIDLTKDIPLGETYQFYPGALLADLGWSSSKNGYAKLYESLSFMRSTQITIIEETEDGKKYLLEPKSILRHLKAERSKDKSERKRDLWAIQLEPGLADLYQRENVNLFAWEMRKRISDTRSDLALWLFSYLNEFAEPRPMPVAYLANLSGLSDMEPRAITQAFKRACDQLQTCEYLESHNIKNGILAVRKKNSAKRISEKSHADDKKKPPADDGGFSEELN